MNHHTDAFVPGRDLKYRRVGFNVVVVAFIALMIDAFLNRDPCVRLPNGYSIVAISAGSPCLLQYEPWKDEREYAGWRALHQQTRDENGRESERFLLVPLVDGATSETLEFDSKQEWEAATRAKNAEPSPFHVEQFSGITQFGTRSSFVIGDHDGGYFILNTAENSVESVETKEEWSRKAAAAGLSTEDLSDPKSWFLQARDQFSVAIVGGFLLITLPWVLRPLWASKRPKVQKVSG